MRTRRTVWIERLFYGAAALFLVSLLGTWAQLSQAMIVVLAVAAAVILFLGPPFLTIALAWRVGAWFWGVKVPSKSKQ